jgi:hypothetical protein
LRAVINGKTFDPRHDARSGGTNAPLSQK